MFTKKTISMKKLRMKIINKSQRTELKIGMLYIIVNLYKHINFILKFSQQCFLRPEFQLPTAQVCLFEPERPGALDGASHHQLPYPRDCYENVITYLSDCFPKIVGICWDLLLFREHYTHQQIKIFVVHLCGKQVSLEQEIMFIGHCPYRIMF